ncbi:aldo/keto reductase [Variovorax sp. J22R133]|uniref:aldo/keto reductase n=1 Tax=Variovorax brevis TaxID=3053503 RepID=UPI0025753010|nr:aldo/keto reductase [Variovorax sp. J22R133]MDM0116261.1 aldo/keto reductase [Variovorax sp. J22R133]
MKLRKLGRTGLDVSPIAFGGATITYSQKSTGWDPRSEEGRKKVIETVHYALDKGINYIDTSPMYGDGYSEEMLGEVMKSRRKDCVLASKSWFELDKAGTIESVHNSLKRLQTDYIDVVQIHGRMYYQADYDHITKEGGPLDGLREMKAQGKIGHIGITSEEPWTLIPFLAFPEVEVFQIAYNFIYQAAARHFLIEAEKVNAGVVTMRTMTSGIMQMQAGYLAPEWQAAHDLYDVALKFVLSDSRVHSGIIGIRWNDEVDRNLAIINNWTPPVDIAKLPRLTFQVYQAEDSK